jgi:hypothetical protein
MKRSEFRQWLEQRLTFQRRVTMGAIAAMGGIGVVAVLLEFWFFYAIIHYAFFSSGPIAFLVTLAITGSMMAWLWIQTPQRIAGNDFTVRIDAQEVKLNIAPAMGPVWTYALGSMEIDRSFVERLLGFLSMPQRMVCAAWQVWKRFEKLQALNVDDCAKVLRLVFRKAERTEVSEIAESCKLEHLPQTMHELSLIDGVVFLTRNGVGLSLANRLIEDLTAWKTKQMSGETDEVFGD